MRRQTQYVLSGVLLLALSLLCIACGSIPANAKSLTAHVSVSKVTFSY